MNLALVIQYLYPSAVNGVDFRVEDSGNGPVLAHWDAVKLNPQPTPAELAAAELPAAKAASIAANRAECSRRIFERYPAGRQLSASFGLYDSANVATMVDWIAANVAAENTAADAIEAAQTVAAVEAVTVAWPV